MAKILSAKEFVARYESLLSEELSGGADVSDPFRNSFNRLEIRSDFINDLSTLSDPDFHSVIQRMSDDAIKAYLYNKYPEFFLRWDRGRDGWIDATDLLLSTGLDEMISEMFRTIYDSRDRKLLAKLPLLKNQEYEARLKRHLQNEHDRSAPRKQSGENAENLIAKYDQMSAKRDGRLTKNEIGLSYSIPRPDATFVSELSALSDNEFQKTLAHMDDDAIKAYLYNKYSQFFLYWDRDPEGAMDGWIGGFEAVQADRMEAMVAQLDRIVADSRDLPLFTRVPLFIDEKHNEELRIAFYHRERRLFFSQLCGRLTGEYASGQEDKHKKPVRYRLAFGGQYHDRFLQLSHHYPNRLLEGSTKNAISNLEIILQASQKFWLRLVARRNVSVTSKENIENLYVIHSSPANAAIDFFARHGKHFLQSLPFLFSRLEIYRGRVNMQFQEPAVSSMNSAHLDATLNALLQLILFYESPGELILKMSSYQRNCPYCREKLDGGSEKILKCAQCNTRLHAVCRDQNRVCTTWGCNCTDFR